jgi:hypothetical protein
VNRHRVVGALVYTHRWLGIVGSLLFVSWFVSGIVMMYAQMPELTTDERMERLAPLDLGTARIQPTEAVDGLPQSPQSVRIGMLDGRPVYRFLVRGRWTTVFADDGTALPPLSSDEAMSAARRFAPEHATTLQYDQRLDDADQWTFGVRGLMPMHRIALGDPAGTNVYVSDQTGEVVLDASASERRWGYAGAVVHWLYFTPFRRRAAIWNETIVWLSIAGCVLSLTGLGWGVWRYSSGRRYRLRRERSHTPYAGLMRWHHYTGLAFGVFTFTWIFSGLLSMDPWAWSPGTAPTRAQRDAVAGGPFTPGALTLERARIALAAFGSRPPKELELVQFQGEAYLRAERTVGGIVLASASAPHVSDALDHRAVEAAALAAMPGVGVQDVVWLNRYDAYYYNRAGALSLPVLRVRYADPVATWLYLDPRRGAIVRKEERLSRLNRWLYHGFHSLDFPFLYYRRPLWDAVVIVLSVGGILLSVTSLGAAYRRLRRHVRI